jgi:oxygen-dependent protoporphyrinogen oxidase
MIRVALIGGGITGLSAAYYLERDYPGVEIDLFEADKELGGRIRTDTSHNLIIEGGPDSFLATKPELVELCEQVGLGPHLIGTNPQVRGAYIFWKNQHYQIPEGIQTGVPTKAKPVLTSPLLSVAGKTALLKDFLVRKGPDGDQSLGYFLRRHFGNEIVDRLAAPMLSGIFAGDIDQMSLKATFPHLLTAEQRARSVYLGSKRRKPPAPNAFVQRYHSVFVSVDRGLQEMIVQIAKNLHHTRFFLSTAVERIEPETEGRWAVSSSSHSGVYDAVLVTTPAYVSARILPFLSLQARDILQHIPYADLAVVGAAYDPADIPIKTDKTGFLVPKHSGLHMTAVTWVSSKWHYPHVDPLFVLRAFYGRFGENILEYDDDALISLFRKELEQTMYVKASPKYLRVFRIPQGMPQYVVGHLDRIAKLERELEPFRHLFVAGAFEGGVGMPDRVKQARKTVQRMAQELELTRSEVRSETFT